MLAETHPLIRARRRAGRVKRWIKRKVYERTIGRQYKAWLAEAATVVPDSTAHPMRISILVPVYNPPIDFLRQCLASVLAQQADNWELLVADDGSTDPQVSQVLDDFAVEHAADPRVIVLHKANGGISSAINAALERATGDYVGMLDHDDLLDPRCIDAFAVAIAEHGEPDAVYSDEDKVDGRGSHFELYCKPDFSPELLLTQMYLCHFTVFRREQVVAAGGLRSQMDGAQDFDLALRLLPNLRRVVHLPRPYYHWRAWSGSTALTIEAKPWAQEAAARAQVDHLERTFGGGTVTPSRIQGLNEVHPAIPGAHLVSVIIPTIGTPSTDGRRRFVDEAVRSLAAAEQQIELEFVIVTTGVIDEVAVDLGRHRIRHVVYQTESFNFAEAINTGRAAASGDYLLLLNDDTTAPDPSPVTRMLQIGQIPGVGITGARLDYPDGRLQHVGMVLLPSGPTHCWIGKPAKEPGYFGSTLTPRNYSAVTAAAMLVRAEVFDAAGGFDTAFARDYNDVDFCLRVQGLGHRVAWTPYARFIHHEGASLARRKPDAQESRLFHDRWVERMPVDPCYSPALNQQLARLYEAL